MTTKHEPEVTWICRFHPTEGFHEVGCPHQEWTSEQLLSALISKKEFEQMTTKHEVKWCECKYPAPSRMGI